MLTVEENIPLAPLTTLKIGGPARYFIRASSEEDVARAVEWARNQGTPLFVLGGGSNVLVSDHGVDGLVLQVAIEGRETDSPNEGNAVRLTAGAGESWDDLVDYCVENDLAGVECLSGIPGLVGGTPVQNVGAYGQEVSETITAARCFDRHANTFTTLSNAECGFKYRTSIFNTSERERYIVVSVTFALVKNGDARLAYKDLIDHFGDSKPSLGDVRGAVLAIRRAKSMVIDPVDPNAKSAGSFFKNAVVAGPKLEEIRRAYPNVPSFVFGEKFKIPAAWLIETAGFHKGYALGNAGISSNHSLALINRGGATAAELVHLTGQIQQAVAQRFDINLQPEPVFMGF